MLLENVEDQELGVTTGLHTDLNNFGKKLLENQLAKKEMCKNIEES